MNGNTKAYNEETGVVEEMKVYEAIPGTFGRIFTKQNTIIFFFVFLAMIVVYYGINALNLFIYALFFTWLL